ncbi:YebC/PmpR family DNA-binding transcriptional regulator [Patescibacteria group bacterium]|nr:MAG: YebC/PmpR family DNA-binding transcriptional regulator [Patescibacteria group bacterium]
MSGHSKWHNIQARKGKQDALRGNLFTKIGKAISVAARSGGGDASSNFSLRLAIEKAKEAGMPKDNIERAIKRGAGELEGAQIEEVLYEGYGPGGVAILIKTLTDNKNRTVSDLKRILSAGGGNMAGAGSVLWMFSQMGVISLPLDKREIGGGSREDFELKMIEAGAEDIVDAEEILEIRTKVENFQKVLGALKELGIEPAESGLRWVAKDGAQVDEATGQKLEKLFAALEENDDVDDFFTNVI